MIPKSQQLFGIMLQAAKLAQSCDVATRKFIHEPGMCNETVISYKRHQHGPEKLQTFRQDHAAWPLAWFRKVADVSDKTMRLSKAFSRSDP
ncbi:hypothetical protein C7477_10829 [Phyllobacterium leguminum]|uniref:Uncharacterized protein n=1 Tax=Phyllobacterium leguminum TaxID=314237 RepID=A0A318T2N2_9HYPH|nr:hypothetical protein C7477_10829 [Phyllobacterium leguminum]